MARTAGSLFVLPSGLRGPSHRRRPPGATGRPSGSPAIDMASTPYGQQSIRIARGPFRIPQRCFSTGIQGMQQATDTVACIFGITFHVQPSSKSTRCASRGSPPRARIIVPEVRARRQDGDIGDRTSTARACVDVQLARAGLHRRMRLFRQIIRLSLASAPGLTPGAFRRDWSRASRRSPTSATAQPYR